MSLIETFDKITLSATKLDEFEKRIDSGELKRVLIPFTSLLVARWTRENLEEEEAAVAQARFRLMAPDGKVLEETTLGQIELGGDKINYQARLEMQTFPYAGCGRYEYTVQQRGSAEARWRTVAKIPVHVVSG